MYFRNYRLWTICLEHSLKAAASEHALSVKMWKHHKYFQNLHESTFIKLFTILREVDLENVSPSFRRNLRDVC